MAPTKELGDGAKDRGRALKGTESDSNFISTVHLYTLSFVNERNLRLHKTFASGCNSLVAFEKF